MKTALPTCLLWLFTSLSAFAAPALDHRDVHDKYENGDFDLVIDALEGFRKSSPTHSRSDSIFIARHLAVVYAANPLTVEKGKHWMHTLLKLMPAADLAGMYVNEEIDRIFEKVKGEYLNRRKSFGLEATESDLAERPAKVAPALPESRWSQSKYWLIGGLAAASVGTVAILYLSQADESGADPDRELVVPNGKAE